MRHALLERTQRSGLARNAIATVQHLEPRRLLSVSLDADLATLELGTSQITAENLTGAIYTSDIDGNVNINLYDSKGDVFLNGGPKKEGAAGLPDGWYYVQVTTPSGAVLGSSVNNVGNQQPVEVVNGSFVSHYRLIDIVSDENGIPGFDDTDNNGGVYKVWVSSSADFDNNLSKTDNFRVAVNDPSISELLGSISGIKFHDHNANGIRDIGDDPLAGFKIELYQDVNSNGEVDENDISFGFVMTGDVPNLGEFLFADLPIGDYVLQEVIDESDVLDPSKWIRTTAEFQPVTLTLAQLHVTDVEFGNTLLGGVGAGTIGFWGNRNGQRAFGEIDDALGLLVGLNLKDGEGNDFNPATYAEFKTWLQGANAVNMQYMLSAQLAAFALNVAWKGLDDNMIYAPDLADSNANGFIKSTDLIAAANAALLGSDRDLQEAIKNVLDDANNNLNWAT